MSKEQVIGSSRVYRGGSLYNNVGYCSAMVRCYSYIPGNRYFFLGFRPCKRVENKNQLKEFKELIEGELFND